MTLISFSQEKGRCFFIGKDLTKSEPSNLQDTCSSSGDHVGYGEEYAKKKKSAYLCTTESTPHYFQMIQRECNGLTYVARQSSVVRNKGVRRMLLAFSIPLDSFSYYENPAF